jgi:hypothetical protein
MMDLFYTDSETGYWKSLQAFWSGIWKPFSVVISWFNNNFSGKSVSDYRHSEEAYDKIIRFSQIFHSSKKIFWILTAKQQNRKKIKNTQHTFRKYWFNLLDLQNKYNISWHCPFKQPTPNAYQFFFVTGRWLVLTQATLLIFSWWPGKWQQ